MAPRNSSHKHRKPPHRPDDVVVMPAWLFLTGISVTAIAAARMAWQGDLVAASVIVIIAGTAYSGFRIGLMQSVCGILAIATAVYFAPILTPRFEDTFAHYAQTTGLINRYACMVTVGVLISLSSVLVLHLIVNRFLAKRTRLKRLNAYAGIAFGAVEAAVLVLLVLGGALSAQLWLRELPADPGQPNRWAAVIDNLAARTRASVLDDTIRDHNPFERIDWLAPAGDIPAVTRRLGDPAEVSALLNDPRIVELTEEPEFAAGLRELQRDPVLRKYVEDGRPIDRRAVLHLLGSPALMKLVDHPRFVPTARDVLLDQ